MLDGEGRVQTWNAGAALIKGYQRRRSSASRSALLHTRGSGDGRPAALLAQAARDGRVEDEGWRVRKDGTRFWADVVITALQNEAGQLIGFAKVTRDLTQRQHAEQERRRLESDRIRAEEALRIRDEFLSVASHELKTPLTALQIELFAMRELADQSTDERLSRKLARAPRATPIGSRAHRDAARRVAHLDRQPDAEARAVRPLPGRHSGGGDDAPNGGSAHCEFSCRDAGTDRRAPGIGSVSSRSS